MDVDRLGWTKVFRRPEMRERMVDLLFEAHAFHGAKVDAFVVMPEHIHCITLLPEHMNAAKFVHSLKKHVAYQLLPRSRTRRRCY